MKAINVSKKTELSDDVVLAAGIVRRMKGLLGREGLRPGESLWIRPCSSVHTVGMKFAIDLLFLDKRNVVIAMKKHLRPNRLTSVYLHAGGVLELPAGTIDATTTAVGDRIEIA
jgi:uncharacterized membrane protein (UPF0127 family)